MRLASANSASGGGGPTGSGAAEHCRRRGFNHRQCAGCVVRSRQIPVYPGEFVNRRDKTAAAVARRQRIA